MKRRAIAKILIEPSGQMFVFPEMESGASYEHIYREANGLRWHSTLRALHAFEPERWEHIELLRHISETIKSACDEQLHLTEGTVWEGVPQDLQHELQCALDFERNGNGA